MSIAAVLLDMDGVLLDSFEAWCAVMNATAVHFGLPPISRDAFGQAFGQSTEADAAARGETVYADNCAACHGESGEGLQDLGAPALNDAIWLYGGTHADIVAQVTAPRHGVMPGWVDRLGETTVKELAVYVHSLGGGVSPDEMAAAE